MPELPRPLLIVSPHLDDAALSCAALLEGGEPVDVLTVFTGEPVPPLLGWWDEETGFASSAEAVPARRREEEAAFAGTPHRVRLLDLLEGQYFDGARDEADARPIEAAIQAWADREGAGHVALPAGAGTRADFRSRLFRKQGAPQHPDHLFVRDAGLAAAERVGLGMLLYEELPYLWGRPADGEVRRVGKATSRRAELLVLAVDREAKARRIAHYRSQLPHISPEGRPLDRPESLPADERYWRLTP